MKNLKKLVFKKEVIAKLNSDSMSNIQGGTNSTVCNNPTTVTIAGNTCKFTCDTPYDHCDMPTINDSCFSWCYDKCNDY